MPDGAPAPGPAANGPPAAGRPGRPQPTPAVYRRRRATAIALIAAVLIACTLLLKACVVGHGVAGADRASAPSPSAAPASPTPAPRVPGSDPAVAATLQRMPLVAIGSKRGRRIALTFDDGPSTYTARIMRVLAREHVPATFFWLGRSARDYPAKAYDHLPAGNWVIGDHTQGHLNLRDRTRQQEAADIDDGATRLRWTTGDQPQLFRPPYGAFDRDTLDLLDRRHMLMVLWSVDSEDYERPGTPAIVRNVVDGARPGGIVLMHDGGGDRTQTLAALPTIIKQLKAKHYRFVTVPGLLKDPPPLRQPQYTIDY